LAVLRSAQVEEFEHLVRVAVLFEEWLASGPWMWLVNLGLELRVLVSALPVSLRLNLAFELMAWQLRGLTEWTLLLAFQALRVLRDRHLSY
jgi:hypothetical protein